MGRPSKKRRHAADNGWIVAIKAVAVNLFEIGEQALDVIECVRALRMAGELHPLPRLRDGRAIRDFGLGVVL